MFLWVRKRERSDSGHRGRRSDLLRLNVVDFQAFQALQASKVEVVVQRQTFS